MSSKGKFFLGAAIGAAAGVVTGILTAPKSGKETRADIKKKAGELKDEAGKKATELKKQAGKVADDVKHTVDDYKSRASRAVGAAKSEFEKEAKK